MHLVYQNALRAHCNTFCNKKYILSQYIKMQLEHSGII